MPALKVRFDAAGIHILPSNAHLTLDVMLSLPYESELLDLRQTLASNHWISANTSLVSCYAIALLYEILLPKDSYGYQTNKYLNMGERVVGVLVLVCFTAPWLLLLIGCSAPPPPASRL